MDEDELDDAGGFEDEDEEEYDEEEEEEEYGRYEAQATASPEKSQVLQAVGNTAEEAIELSD